MNQSSQISAERVRLAVQARMNPIRGLTPEVLVSQIDQFKVGYLRAFALTMEAIEERDPMLASVAAKRKKAPARLDWEVLTVDDSPAAARHQAALEYFWNHVECTHALEQDQRGGLRLLLRQMMGATGSKYAVHEIVWKPAAEASAALDPESGERITGLLSAEFRFVPLHFFEARAGKLRFLASEFATEGVEMKPGEWLVTAGDHLLLPSAIAYMFKTLPLKDWLALSEKFGMPGLILKTDAAPGSAEWEALKVVGANFGNDFAAVISRAAEAALLEARNLGNLPYPELVELMDRYLAIIWRGGDLSTLSKRDAVGANPQEDESDLLLGDDAASLEETLQERVERFVIAFLFGAGVEPLAYLKLNAPKQQNITQDLAVDEFLLRAGAPLAVNGTLGRYGRPVPDKDEPLLQAPVPASGPVATTNEADTRRRVLQALAGDVQPVNAKLERILQIQDPEILRARLIAFQAEMPALLKDLNQAPASVEAIREMLAEAFEQGVQRHLNPPATAT